MVIKENLKKKSFVSSFPLILSTSEIFIIDLLVECPW